MYVYVLMLFYWNGPVMYPQAFKTFEDFEECIAEAIIIQEDKSIPFNAACIPTRPKPTAQINKGEKHG